MPLTSEYARSLTKHMNAMPLPPLGDAAKQYHVDLTEPEINAIHAAAAFIESCCAAAGMTNYWEHYGPTLEGLSQRLAVFDDGNAPRLTQEQIDRASADAVIPGVCKCAHCEQARARLAEMGVNT